MPVFLVLAGASWAQPAGEAASCPVRLGEPAGLGIGPYVTDVGMKRFTVRWEEGFPGLPVVRVGGPDGRRVVGEPAVRLPQAVRWQEPPVPPGWLYAVTIDGLQPSTRYEYAVECGSLAGRRVTAATAPRPGEVFTFVALGDTRSGHGDHRLVVRGLSEHAPELVVNTGDIVEAGFHEEWQTFFGVEGGLAASVPVLVAYGNHEAVVGSKMFDAYFPCAQPGPPGSRSCAYEFGGAQILVLDTEGTLDQAGWVRRVLMGRRSALSIVVLHRPIYTFSRHAHRLDWRALLHPVLTDSDVELVFQGHNHVYERFEVGDVTYVTTGGGGAPPYPTEGNYNASEAPLRKAADARLHFVVAKVAADRADLQAVDARTGAVFDRFSVH